MLSTGDDCVRSCEDVNDGDYQNCRRCSIYTVCLGGELTEGFCPEGQGWDNTADSCKEDPAGDCELKKVEAGSAIATAPGVLAILLGLGKFRQYYYCAVRRQTAVTAYFSSKQLLLFAFASNNPYNAELYKPWRLKGFFF